MIRKLLLCGSSQGPWVPTAGLANHGLRVQPEGTPVLVEHCPGFIRARVEDDRDCSAVIVEVVG
jgi:hypothetical protein